MNRTITHLLATFSVLTASALVACGDSDSKDGKQDAGGSDGGPSGSGGASTAATDCTGDCACDKSETCSYECTGECTVECLGGTCSASCPAGGCTLDTDFGGHADYTCAGGNCESDCDTGSTCNVDCSGGGCTLVCDGESTCSLKCGADGPPCTATCEAGGKATCTGGNCTLVNCDEGATCDPTPDPDYDPAIVPSDFSSTVDNPLLPWPVGATWRLESDAEVIEITVLAEKKTIMGVECVVVRDTVKTPEGELVEDTFDWYAQQKDGTVWYFGEDTKEYVGGQVASTEGSWEAGVDDALPGIVMQASPALTDPPTKYRQEYLVCEAEDEAEIVAVGETVTVPAGTYTDCIRTREFTRLEPAANEFKIHCPGVGNVLVIDATTGERLEELTAVDIP